MNIAAEANLIKKNYLKRRASNKNNIWTYINKYDNLKQITLDNEDGGFVLSYPMKESIYNNMLYFKLSEKENLDKYINNMIINYL